MARFLTPPQSPFLGKKGAPIISLPFKIEQ